MKTVTFDIESTGVRTDTDRIITCFMRAKDGDKVLFERNWILNAGVKVPQEASDVHHMTTEWVREHGRTDVASAIFEIADALAEYSGEGYVVAAYNGAYDLSILDAEVQRYHNVSGLPALMGTNPRFIDPAIFSRVFDKYVKGGHKLITVAQRNGIEVEEDRLHAADYDVEVTEKLVKIMLNRAWRELPELRERAESPDDFISLLQGWQANEKYKWAEHTTQYFESAGKTEDDGSKIVVSGAFPW